MAVVIQTFVKSVLNIIQLNSLYVLNVFKLE